MLCGICRKNQATKTYEQIKNGKVAVEYYCLDCYHRQFISADNKADASVCPACGTTVEEVKKRNLVGCAYCYKAFQNALVPVISKLAGNGTPCHGSGYGTSDAYCWIEVGTGN